MKWFKKLFGGTNHPAVPTIEFLKFKHNLRPGLYVDNFPYELVIVMDGEKKVAKGDLGHMLTQDDFNGLFMELTGLTSMNGALMKYQFIYSRNFIKDGGGKYVPRKKG